MCRTVLDTAVIRLLPCGLNPAGARSSVVEHSAFNRLVVRSTRTGRRFLPDSHQGKLILKNNGTPPVVRP